MDLPDVIAHCLSLPGAEETTPFGPEALVYKVSGKMFAITVPEDFPARINLKCDPNAPSSCGTSTRASNPAGT
jgi:predicted DNA-binding protein (MmcQ/YjbR family)